MADYSKIKCKELFAARILARGYDYYLDGNVWDGPSTKYEVEMESVEFLTQMQIAMDTLKKQVV